MAWAGGGTDEYKVEASALNQTFVGMEFGLNRGSGRVLYGRLAAFDVKPGEVVLWLDGVTGSAAEVAVSPSTELWFSHYSTDRQILDSLTRIEQLLEGKPHR